MFDNCAPVLGQTSLHHGNLLLIGLAIFGGTVGARVFKQLKIPQVVAYVAIGVLMGQSGLRLLNTADVKDLQPFTHFALGVIGFLVGGELRIGTFRKYAKQFLAILLSEGLFAFILVGTLCSLLMYLVVHNISIAVAMGLVLGAIASATDPASTIDVLWEYRARGILTTSITAIVALDDALAMILYALGTSIAEMATGASGSVLQELGKIVVELFGAAVMGLCFALLLRFLLRWLHQPEMSLAIAIGMILVLIGLAVYFNMDVILSGLVFGFTLVNVAPRRSKEMFSLLRSFSAPIYVLFFVLVGARLGLEHMPWWLWCMVVVYLLGRTLGKWSGAWLGGAVSGSERPVRRYLGLGLLAQGGVAVGLSIMASHHLAGIKISDGLSLGDAIVFAVAATTLLSQLAGPAMVKLSVKLADEIGRKVTAEDVIESMTVADVMDPNVAAVQENLPLSELVRTFANRDYLVYPVVNAEGRLIGTVSLAGIKSALSDKHSWAWLVASDLAEPVTDKAVKGAPLKGVLDQMRGYRIEQMPVVDSEEDLRPLGMLDMTHILKQVDNELIRRQEPAVLPG